MDHNGSSSKRKRLSEGQITSTHIAFAQPLVFTCVWIGRFLWCFSKSSAQKEDRVILEVDQLFSCGEMDVLPSCNFMKNALLLKIIKRHTMLQVFPKEGVSWVYLMFYVLNVLVLILIIYFPL